MGRELLSRRELADALGIHPQTVTKLVGEGLPVAKRGRPGSGHGYREADCRAWTQARQQLAETDQLDLTRERARKERAQALLAEQKYKLLEGELLPREEVAKVWSAHVAAVRAYLLAVPDFLTDEVCRAFELEGQAGVYSVLRKAMHETLTELARPDADEVPAAPKRKRKVKATKKRATKKKAKPRKRAKTTKKRKRRKRQ